MTPQTFIIVKIAKWKDYNPRSDVKSPSWFRMNHSLFDDSDFFDFSHAELLSWIYILSAASKKNSETVRITFAHLEQIGRIKISDFQSAITKLQSLGIVLVPDTCAIRVRYVCDTPSPATNETNETNETYGTPEKVEPARVGNPELKSQIEECGEAFRETLRHFKQGRTLLESETFHIGRMIQAQGAKAVRLALIGARYEPRSEKWDPANWVDLNRYLDPKNFKRMLGYGVKAALDEKESQGGAT